MRRRFKPISRGLHIISDDMTPVKSMATGNIHHSKSAYRRELVEEGHRRDTQFVEVGNEYNALTNPPRKSDQMKEREIERDIHRAINERT